MPILIKKYPECAKELGGAWLTSLKGYIIFNYIVMLFVNQILKDSFMECYNNNRKCKDAIKLCGRQIKIKESFSAKQKIIKYFNMISQN